MLRLGTRNALYLGACVPARIALAGVAAFALPRVIGILLLVVIGVSFLTLWAGDYRMRAPEGGGRTWWSQGRIVHAILFLAAAALVAAGQPGVAFSIMVLSVIFGLGQQQKNMLAEKKVR